MLDALSIGFTVIFSPADEEPFPGGGNRARAADANFEVAAGLGFGLTCDEEVGFGWRMGLATREAVCETKAFVGRVKGIYFSAGIDDDVG
jgi:hypothetical protein